MGLKEADLYQPVKAWLEGQGLKVYPEVPMHYSPIDVVGIGENLVVGVEMKRLLSWKVVYQAARLDLSCNRSYAAVAAKPRSLERAVNAGIGVLRVVGGAVEVLLEPQPKITPNEHYVKQIREKCSHMTGEGVGGVPCLDGVGPAQQCKKRVEEYQLAHPKCSWREIYANVPNHYASFESMRGALVRGLALRAEFKKRRRKEAAARRKDKARTT